MAKVVINNISKSYDGKTRVLKDFNLEIASGEMFFLLGPSGCGKSTLLRILAGLVEQDSGSISFDDVDITDLPPEKRRAAMVFQNYALWPHLDVFENVVKYYIGTGFDFYLKQIDRHSIQERLL